MFDLQMTQSTSTRGALRVMLAGGALAGPIYVASVASQAVFREGFDLGRHPASVLSNGEHGWIQVATFLVTGALYVAGAIALRRVLAPGGGPGGAWGPLLIGIFGAGMIAAAIFPADPVDGFPPGTPDGPPTTISAAGLGHFAVSSLAFVALIAACFVFARRFASTGSRGWMLFSILTGALFLASWLSLFIFAGVPAANLALAVSIGVALVWTTLLFARQLRAR